ncbi:MAG TPA: DegT/DnrJ/EryC1/StrS family aminotransferase [Candidatus Tumulicola sp.]|jgi:dTDP-4-amino-4,6-dideoxygalactose transaminase
MNDSPTIPLIDLKMQYAGIRAEVAAALDGVLTSAAFVMGEDVAAFEREFARYTGTSQCVGVASGTSALKLGMQALGIGPGDEVILPANTSSRAPSPFRMWGLESSSSIRKKIT